MTEAIILTLLGACGVGITSAVSWLVVQLRELKEENQKLRTRIDSLEAELLITKAENERHKEAMLRMDERVRQQSDLQKAVITLDTKLDKLIMRWEKNN